MIAPEDASLLRRTCFFLTSEVPDRRTSELASTFDTMERLYALDELGPFQDGKQGWPGWHHVRLRTYVVEQEVGTLGWTNSSQGKPSLFHLTGIIKLKI